MKYRRIFDFIIFVAGFVVPIQGGALPIEQPVVLDRENFQKEMDGKKVDLYTISNGKGMVVKITNYGAKIEQILVPDRDGVLDDVILGYETIDQVVSGQPSMNAFIGRYANRIDKGNFSLEGQEVQLFLNNGAHTLHGGKIGSRFVVFDAKLQTKSSIQMSYLFKDMEENFPGNLMLTLTYKVTEENALEITYQATTDKTTVINFTSHGFFNLSGRKSKDILDHKLMINSNYFTPIDETLIPTGEIIPVENTPFDFRLPYPIGARIEQDDDQLTYGSGYDHNWVLNKNPGEYGFAARVYDPKSGRVMEVFTTEPGLQFYSGNFLEGKTPRDVGKGGNLYTQRSGFCLEPQHFPDSVHKPHFPSTILRAGETYRGKIVYKFSAKSHNTIHLLDPMAVFTEEELLPLKGMKEIINVENSPRRSDEEMEIIWGPLRVAEQNGLKPTVYTSARLYAFGGGQDLPYFIKHGAATDPQSLEDVPSLFLICGGGRVYGEISLAKDELGNHLKNVFQYENPILDHHVSMEVPIRLQEPYLETEKGQHQAAQYKLGNLARLRGLRIKITTDNPLIMKTGGFEVSNVYNWNIDQWIKVFLNQLGEDVTTAQLFVASRFAAQNVLKDPSGFQGVLAALGGISRDYFAQSLIQKFTQEPCETLILQKTYSEECRQKIAAFLNHHSMIVLPKATFSQRELISPRHAKYTSWMMAALVKQEHPNTLENIQEMRRLVSQIENSILLEDCESLVSATARYTAIRIEAQETWLRLACDAKNVEDHPYRSFFLEAEKDPFLHDLLHTIGSHEIPDSRYTPYLGGEWKLLELARQHQVSCIPNGAGGFHCSWAIFGTPQNLSNFLKEAHLSEKISLEKFEQTLTDSESTETSLKGIIPVEVLSGAGTGTNEDFVTIYGELECGLPICKDKQINELM